MYKYIAEKESELTKCLKCGTCLYACPLYAEMKYEPTAPRGRIALIESAYKGEIDLTDVFKKRLAFCLNCKSCVEACPSGVRGDDLVLLARAELVNRGKITYIERFIFRFLLKRGRLLPPVARWATFMGRLATKILPENNPLTLFLPFPDGWKERIYPKIAKKTLKDLYPEVVKVENPKMRVGYFVGCGTNLVYPNVGDALIKVLTHNDIEVVIPQDQICCGTSIYNSGDFKTGIKHAQKNLEIFNNLDIDCIVTNCASCGLTLKKEYEELLKVGKFKVPVYDINEFLANQIQLKTDFKETNNYKVTYHDPCHLNRGQGIKSQPRNILKNLPGVEFYEMKEADRCCGGGGSFHLKYYPISKGIMEHKLENIEKIPANTLVTSCPGCMMRFEETFLQRKMPIKVKHVVEILKDAYGL
jgi:glycolate oxidase iron-sulfur subunit